MALKVFKVKRVRLEAKARRESKVQRERRVKKETLVLPEVRGRKGYKAQKVMQPV